MIRLQRVGRKHEPVFRLVLTDSKNGPKSGKFLEILGSFDARRSEKAEFKTDRVKDLVSKGAKLSGTVHNLLVSKKLIEGKKINVLPLKKAIAKTPTDAEQTPTDTEAKAEAPSQPVLEIPAEEIVPEPLPEIAEAVV